MTNTVLMRHCLAPGFTDVSPDFPEQDMIFKITQAYLAQATETFRFIKRQVSAVTGTQNQPIAPGIFLAKLLNGFKQNPTITLILIFWVDPHQRQLMSLRVRQQVADFLVVIQVSTSRGKARRQHHANSPA